MLKPALQLKLGQQLTMTPQLQQAIRLLQLPVLELQAQVQEALESNVMLEAEEEEQIDLTSLDQPTPTGEDDEVAPDTTDEIVVEMEDPWAESSTPSGDGARADDDDRPLEFSDDRGNDLHQHLVWQLEISKLDPRQLWIGEAIVDALNDDGYLTSALEEIGLGSGAPLERVRDVQAKILMFDKKWEEARAAFQRIVRDYPSSSVVPQSYFFSARCASPRYTRARPALALSPAKAYPAAASRYCCSAWSYYSGRSR